MEKLKVLARNVKPTQIQLENYSKLRNHTRNTNLRFGTIVGLSDPDLDG